jgi:hypothetical protein
MLRRLERGFDFLDNHLIGRLTTTARYGSRSA